MTAGVETAVTRIRAWGERRDWRGWDPYDGLNSPLAPVLTLGTRTGRRVLTQTVKLAPVQIRPLLGIRPAHNAKAIGLVASGYARLWAAAGDEAARAQARRWLDWLSAHPAPTAEGRAWGYHFPVQTRVFRYERGAPNAIATSFVCQALLDGVELAGEDERGAEVEAAVAYTRGHLRHGAHFTYLEGEQELVHNANLLVCGVLARAARVLGRGDLLGDVRAALEPTLAAQRPDGSWPYAASHGWVDNFHTGYVLEALAEVVRSLPEVRDALHRGVDYWRDALFLPDGRPKYYAQRTWPMDAHCYATAIDTWVALAGEREEALPRAERLAEVLVEDLLAPSGYVYFQRRRRYTNRVALVRWSTAPSFKALAGLLLLRRRPAIQSAAA